jgi:peptide deformylase
MATLKIYTGGAPILRRKARPVRHVDASMRKLVDDMFVTMREAPGVGLAGPQVGVPQRLIVVEFEGSSYALANPDITWRSPETEIGEEGCLSLPSLYGDVERARSVRLRALDMNNKRVTISAEGWLARIFQHEIDHLDGILFTDRMAPDAPLRHVRSAGTAEEI